jgi:hypothetical protein
MKIVKIKKARKYVAVRIPVDVYDEAVKVKQKLEQTGLEIFGKPVSVPLTRVFRIKMATPTTIPDALVRRIVKKRK